MKKEIILQQKREKELLLSQNYIARDKLEFAKKFMETDLIKVITGPRRAGKSVFAILCLKDRDFAYINFDDENLLKIKNPDEILEGIFEVYGKTKFILFDEIQNLPNWEIFVNKLQRRGYNLTITGSNAKLLSKEFATALTGRYVLTPIFPFSFKEFLRAKKFLFWGDETKITEVKGQILNYLDEYLKSGGFPEVVVKNIESRTYLDTLFDATIFKDIIKRYNVRFSQKIYDLSLYLTANFASEFSFTKLKNILDFSSTNTLQNYLDYLCEAYLVFLLNRFSFKIKEQIKTPKKVYFIDNGFIQAKSFQFSQNTGKLMENLIFGEFLKRGYEPNKNIFSYKTRNKREIDFVLKEGIKIKTLIQTSYQTTNVKTEERELKGLVEGSEELKCNNLIIITWDKEGEEKFKNKRIKVVPLWKWLIEY